MEMTEIKIRNWRIQFDEPTKAAIAGLLMYDGKVIPRWGCGMRFIIDKNSIRYDWPEVVPEYVKKKLESYRRLYI